LPTVTLPRNLTETLKRLEDGDLETLQRAVNAEVKRRRAAKPAPQAASPAQPPAGQSDSSDGMNEVPTGKVNLIRASYRAGMKPSAIARTLRVSLALVNRVLGSAEKAKR
jgi:DNA invertase Pin-like site-specific DNA recombinase